QDSTRPSEHCYRQGCSWADCSKLQLKAARPRRRHCRSPRPLGQVVATTISPPVALICGISCIPATESAARRSHSGCGHVGNPAGVVQAVREQSGMSTPIRAALWISGCVDHLLSEQIDQQQGYLAFRAVTAQADGVAKEIAVWAASLAD